MVTSFDIVYFPFTKLQSVQQRQIFTLSQDTGTSGRTLAAGQFWSV